MNIKKPKKTAIFAVVVLVGGLLSYKLYFRNQINNHYPAKIDIAALNKSLNSEYSKSVDDWFKSVDTSTPEGKRAVSQQLTLIKSQFETSSASYLNGLKSIK